jgi:hypothetical protein
MGLDLELVVPGPPGKRSRRPSFEQIGLYVDGDHAFEQAVEDAITRSSQAVTTPMIIRLKPFGSTVLHPDDMTQLIAEVRVLAGDRAASYVEPIVALAELCARTAGSELHVDGD